MLSFAPLLVVQSVTGLSSLRPRFNPRPVNMGCMVDKKHWDRFSSNYVVFPCHYHSTDAPYLFIHLSLALYNLINLQLCYMMHWKKLHLCLQHN